MSEIVKLEKQIEAAKEIKAQRDLMLKLVGNREFKKLIIEGFCRDEAARFAHLSTDPNMTAEARADSLGSAQAAGYLKRWINAIIIQGNMAERELPEAESILAEMRAEESNED